LSAPNLSKIQFAISYETRGESRLGKPPLDFYNPALMEKMIKEFRYLKETFFNHPSYWRINNRPVVVLHNSRIFRNFKEEYLEDLKNAIGTNIYIISDEVYFDNQADPKTARNRFVGYDAFTSYSMFDGEKAEKLEFQSPYQYYERFVHPIYQKWAEETVFMPCISPDYKEFTQGPSRSGNYKDFQKIIQYVQSLPYTHHVSREIDQVFIINSFNQWFDWTNIEPSDCFGTDYLDAIKVSFKKK
jgi:hypothetical protein